MTISWKSTGGRTDPRRSGAPTNLPNHLGFLRLNIDLIAGMVGETEDNWQDCVEKSLALEADSLTIYQMEVPYNTTIYKNMKDEGSQVAPVADWPTKRRWVDFAFSQLEKAGYHVSSAYTAVKDPAKEPIRLPGSIVVGSRHDRSRRCVFLSHRRHPFPERTRYRPLYGQNRAGRTPHPSSLHTDPGRRPDKGAHPSVEAGTGETEPISRRSSSRIFWSDSAHL